MAVGQKLHGGVDGLLLLSMTAMTGERRLGVRGGWSERIGHDMMPIGRPSGMWAGDWLGHPMDHLLPWAADG